MKILVINTGSSSLKYTLFNMEHETVVFEGTIERIGLEDSIHSFGSEKGQKTVREVLILDHGTALDEMLSALVSEGAQPLDRITAVAHRIAHGGKYRKAVRIDADVTAEIKRMIPMMPLHHPAMIKEIEECRIRMPHAAHIAVFDTSFHAGIPEEAAIYGLPYRYYSESGYRRVGFHGNSFAYVVEKTADFIEKPIEELKIIVCHLGNGASTCAVDRGKSVDTTLGATSLGGLIMGTRCGDVDPGLIPVIMQEDSLSPAQMITMLYKECGLLGISGISSDMREVEEAASQGNERAILAFNAFCHSVKRSIGSMLMILGRCDLLVFTGGIGCNSAAVRRQVLLDVENLGFVLDEAANQEPAWRENSVADISSASSRVKILAVRTFEELMMARQCCRLC